jgi:hypothetical protein
MYTQKPGLPNSYIFVLEPFQMLSKKKENMIVDYENTLSLEMGMQVSILRLSHSWLSRGLLH